VRTVGKQRYRIFEVPDVTRLDRELSSPVTAADPTTIG